LDFCSVPRSKAEISDFLGVKSAYYVVAKYIRPLLASGLLRMTLPATPKSKRQRYIAAAGRR
jgi:ATP-dependent DNA helicase RecG